MPDWTDPLLSDIALEWVKTLPYPILICSAAGSVRFRNAPATALFERLGLALDRFDPPVSFKPYTMDGSSFEPDRLSEGQHYLQILELAALGTYHFRAVKLRLQENDYLCYMFVPALRSGNTRFPDVLDVIDCFVAEFAEDGKLLYVNPQLVDELGYRRDASDKLDHLGQFHVYFGSPALLSDLEQARSGEIIKSQAEFRRKDSSHFTVATTLLHYSAGGRNSYLLTGRDITAETDQKRLLTDALTEATLVGDLIQKENNWLRSELRRSSLPLPPVIGGKQYQQILQRIEQVAPTQVPVLIEGEPGTGKNMIARLVHRLSTHKDGPFVPVDCTALPDEMMESELFGYRRGVFTGSFKNRVGRLAAAAGGTLYLHEVGELSLRLQQKVLTAVKSGTFTPPGETTALAMSARIVTGSSHDLAASVRDGQFREDFYSLLTDFPIRSIPLRERTEDLPQIISQFIDFFNQKYEREVQGVDEQTMRRLRNYSYPGNIKELESMIKQAFLDTRGDKLLIDIPLRQKDTGKPLLDVFDGMLTEFLSLDEYQRKYIELVLEATDGKVSGPNGAAEILKVNPQTLFSKMKRLGIKR